MLAKLSIKFWLFLCAERVILCGITSTYAIGITAKEKNKKPKNNVWSLLIHFNVRKWPIQCYNKNKKKRKRNFHLLILKYLLRREKKQKNKSLLTRRHQFLSFRFHFMYPTPTLCSCFFR